MQPLVAYLLGEPHPLGKRLVNSQKAIRLQDIDEVGDNRHTTFFEMLGNWSLGDYFKQEQLPWIFTFLTEEIGLNPKRLYVTVFEGNAFVPKDIASINIWKEIFSSVGIDAKEGERIFAYPARKNWWSRSGEPENMPPGEPGGPDSEIFFDFGEHLRLHEKSPWKNKRCHPNCDCGRFMEIANSVFMQYQKQENGSVKELTQKNVDFGGGLERIVAAANDDPDVFKTDTFVPIIHALEELTGKPYIQNNVTSTMRIIADHIKAATLLIIDGVLPSNKGQGYVLRRLLRRTAVKYATIRKHAREYLPSQLSSVVLDVYDGVHNVRKKEQEEGVYTIVEDEIKKFQKTLDAGLTVLQKTDTVDGKIAFDLYQTYGFPLEITTELLMEKGQRINKEEFYSEFKKHQELSRTAATGMFRGGLADQSEETTRLHTAHHLFLAALQKIVDPTIKQRGSNITKERLRMDVNLHRKLSEEEITRVEALVNEKINEGLPVVRVDMEKIQAEKIGAQMEFGKKYPDRVSVYFVGSQKDFFSAEFCGGPHVRNTKEIGAGGKTFKILKEESIGSGIRRFKAALV